MLYILLVSCDLLLYVMGSGGMAPLHTMLKLLPIGSLLSLPSTVTGHVYDVKNCARSYMACMYVQRRHKMFFSHRRYLLCFGHQLLLLLSLSDDDERLKMCADHAYILHATEHFSYFLFLSCQQQQQ